MGSLRFFDLNQYISQYKIGAYIETGVHRGEVSFAWALQYPFKVLHGIDLNPAYLEALRSSLSDDRVQLWQGFSNEVLPEVLKIVDKEIPILFWLDAHFPQFHEMGSQSRELEIPLESELNIIAQYRAGLRDVIITDDTQIYEDGPYEAGNSPLRLHYGLNGIEFMYKIFAGTHNITRDYRNTGFVIFTPK